MINVKSFFIVLCLSVLMTDANASVSKGYNRAHLLAQIKRAIKSPKIPGSPNIPGALIGLGVTGLIDGIEKIQKDMENPNFIDEQAREHISHTDTETTHGGAGGAIGYDYIFDGTVYSSPDEVRSAMLRRIDENGWKLTRQRDGYYYQHWQVNMENRTMKLYAQVGRKDDPVCAKMNNRCGWDTSFVGYIVPIGKTNKKTIINSKEQARDIALDKVINDLIDKHEQELKSATPQELPQDKDKPKPVPVPNEATDEATQVQTLPTPKDPPKPFEVPKFCTWATPVCNFMDWVKQEPTDKPQDLVIPKKEINLKNPADFDKNYIAVNDKCPADIVKDFDTGFKKEQIVISFSPICSTIYDYFRPVIIFLAYIGAIFVISSAFKIG